MLYMDLIKIKSRDDLEELAKEVKHGEGRYVNIALISDIIKPKHIPGDMNILNMKSLLPTPKIINRFLDNGIKEEYRRNYYALLRRPPLHYLINKMVHDMVAYNICTVLLCAEDEKQYKYIDMIGDFIDDNYGITPISLKKHKKGIKSHITMELSKLINLCNTIEGELLDKMEDSGVAFIIDRTMTQTDVDRLPKKVRKVIQKYLNISDSRW